MTNEVKCADLREMENIADELRNTEEILIAAESVATEILRVLTGACAPDEKEKEPRCMMEAAGNTRIKAKNVAEMLAQIQRALF